MPATNILAKGDTKASSSEIVVAAGTPVVIGLEEAVSGAKVQIELKNSKNSFINIGLLSFPDKQEITLYGPATYRFSRQAGRTCRVFRG